LKRIVGIESRYVYADRCSIIPETKESVVCEKSEAEEPSVNKREKIKNEEKS